VSDVFPNPVTTEGAAVLFVDEGVRVPIVVRRLCAQKLRDQGGFALHDGTLSPNGNRVRWGQY
jgi:hypothetical protein